MFLAIKEMRRTAVRFGLLVVAVALLVFLILFQQALRDGLVTSFVGAIRNQSAAVLVYSVDGQRTLQGSLITPPIEQAVRELPGVDAVARIGQSTFTVLIGDEESDASIIGTDDADVMAPTELEHGRRPAAPGEAVGSDADFDVDDVVSVIPAAGAEPVTLTVVGTARDVQLSVTPTLFTDLDTYGTAVRAVNPDAGDMLPNALAVRPVDGTAPEQLAEAIEAAAADAEALTRDAAANTTPGVFQVRQSFQIIFLLYGLVVPLVTGLFFLIMTLQKAGSLTLLRAIGASTRTLATTLLIQVVLVVTLGLLLGIAMYYPLSQAEVASLSLRFNSAAVLTWSALLMALALLSALVSLRRVSRIDPIEAATGGTR